MLKLDPGQMHLLDRRARERFRSLLSAQLRAAYPALWTPLPIALAERIVGARIDHAQERYDIHFQSALTTFLHYCCSFGAHFDRQPAIEAVLDDPTLFPDDIPDLLPARAGDAAWAAALHDARRSDWLDRLAQPDRVAARYCWALHEQQRRTSTYPTEDRADDRADDRAEDPAEYPALREHIAASIAAAQQHRIGDDAGLAAFALCRTLLGREFDKGDGKPWVRPIFNDPAILPALRGATLAGCAELEWALPDDAQRRGS